VLDEQLRDEWNARERGMLVSSVMELTLQGLVLGAGTILVPLERRRCLKSLRGREARVLALLSAAYGKAIQPSVLGNIERAGKAWSAGDDCLAYIHLAHAGLAPPDEHRAWAHRLLMAHCAMLHGAPPRAVFEALHLDTNYIDTVERLYNPDEPRVPAGSGRTSGEWTDSQETGGDDPTGEVTTGEGTGGAETAVSEVQGSTAPGRMPLPAASFLGELDAAQVAELGSYASRLAGPLGAAVAAFGLLFIPSPNNVRVEGEVPEIPGLRYSWNRDETEIHLTYADSGGAQRTFALHLDGDNIRDDDGRIVGQVIGGNRIAIDTAAILPDLVKQDEPRLCPAYAPDVAGSDQGKKYEENRSRQYEDFVKLLINPPPNGPTPSGFVYYLPSPAQSGQPVSYDDCQRTTGVMFEFKGQEYANLIKVPQIAESITDEFLDQSGRQIAASGGRSIVWVFAEKEAALFARKLFDDAAGGRERITVVYVPWTKRRP